MQKDIKNKVLRRQLRMDSTVFFTISENENCFQPKIIANLSLISLLFQEITLSNMHLT